jgi:hypothetical protein
MELTREMVATSVINQLTNTIVELNVIFKIYKYRRIHEGHHFIPMAIEVHGAPGSDMDHFITKCVRLFHDR